MSPSVARSLNPETLTSAAPSAGRQLTTTPAGIRFGALMQQQFLSADDRSSTEQSRPPIAATNPGTTSTAHADDAAHTDNAVDMDDAAQRALQPKATPANLHPGFDTEPRLETHSDSRSTAAIAGAQMAYQTNLSPTNLPENQVRPLAVPTAEPASQTSGQKAAPISPNIAPQVAPQETSATRSTDTSKGSAAQSADPALQPASPFLSAKPLAPARETDLPAGSNTAASADTRVAHQAKKPMAVASSPKIPIASGPSATAASHSSAKPLGPDSSPAIATTLPAPGPAPSQLNQPVAPNLPLAVLDSTESTRRASKGSWVGQPARETMQPADPSTASEGHLQTPSHVSPQTRLELNSSLKTDHNPPPTNLPPAAMDHSSLQIPATDAQAHARAISAVESGSPSMAAALPAIHPASGITSGITGARQAPPATHVAPSVTFDRLDSAAAPQTLESTPQRLAVGVQNSGLGWVEIRTNREAGQISSTMATGSVESHAALSAQLPAVREYLAEHQVHVDSLGSERFSQSSGDREGSTGQRSPQQGARESRNPEPIHAPISSDSDADDLSYISVRV